MLWEFVHMPASTSRRHSTKSQYPPILKNVQLINWVKKTIAFIADYLNGRTQQVVIGEAMPSSIDVLSGVPRVAAWVQFYFVYLLMICLPLFSILLSRCSRMM